MCHASEVLAAYHDGSLPPGEREKVERHAADCPACREVLLFLGVGRRQTPARVFPRRLWAGAAAAALLVAAGMLWREGGESRSPASMPAAPSAFTRASDRSLVLGRSGALTLKAGSRVKLTPGAVELLEGALWLEDPGELLSLKAAGARVEVERGVLLLETSFPRGFSWLSQAYAEEGARARLVVLSGAARVGDLAVGAGQEILLGEGSPRPMGSLSWRGDAGWERLAGLPRKVAGGEHPLVPGSLGSAYVWEALVRKTRPGISAAVSLGDGERGWLVPLGAPWLEEGGALRLRVEAGEGWVRLMAGPYEVLHKSLESLAEAGLDAASPRCGLRVWGAGEVEVLESRWRTP